MSARFVLTVTALALASQVAGAGDELARIPRESLFCHQRSGRCQVSSVKPFFSVPNGDYVHPYFESVAVGRHGDIYTSEQCTGDVYRLRPDGRATVIATIPYGVANDTECSLAGGLGLTISRDGALWLAVLSWLPQSHGVWRIGEDGYAELAVPMPPDEAPIPNGVAFDARGNLYVTESLFGVIWRAVPGGQAEPWLASSLLAPPEGSWFGANGIVYERGALYVANTDKGTVLRVPIRRDGSPGKPSVISSGLDGPDGLALDALGELYAVTAYGAELVRIRRGLEPEVVVDLRSAGVAYPTGVDFRKSPAGDSRAYVANFVPLAGEPNLVEVNLCERRR